MDKKKVADVKCPFCGESDYDLIGLKHHLIVSCDNYDATPLVRPPKPLRSRTNEMV